MDYEGIGGERGDGPLIAEDDGIGGDGKVLSDND